MVTPRNIALVFLSLEALAIGLAPLILISFLAYGVYRLRKLINLYWPQALSYLEQGREAVEQVSRSIARPFFLVQGIFWMIRAIIQNLIPRRPA